MPILVLLAILAMPLVEIGGFVLVGGWIGLGPTLLLVILSGVLGVFLLRRQGLASMRRMQAEMRAGRVPGAEMFDTVLIGIAGFLLLVPGFVSDIVGLLLFLPPVRALVRRALARRVVVAGTTARRPAPGTAAPGQGPAHRPTPTVIDLSGEDYRRSGDPDSPWRADGSDEGPTRRTLH